VVQPATMNGNHPETVYDLNPLIVQTTKAVYQNFHVR
jgi:hypothetical protein